MTFDVVTHRQLFTRAILVASVLLMIPLVASMTVEDFNWSAGDFLVMGVMLTVACAAIMSLQRQPQRTRIAGAALVLVVFCYAWAELAVGLLF